MVGFHKIIGLLICMREPWQAFTLIPNWNNWVSAWRLCMEENKKTNKQNNILCELIDLITHNPSAMKIIQEIILTCKISETFIHLQPTQCVCHFVDYQMPQVWTIHTAIIKITQCQKSKPSIIVNDNTNHYFLMYHWKYPYPIVIGVECWIHSYYTVVR